MTSQETKSHLGRFFTDDFSRGVNRPPGPVCLCAELVQVLHEWKLSARYAAHLWRSHKRSRMQRLKVATATPPRDGIVPFWCVHMRSTLEALRWVRERHRRGFNRSGEEWLPGWSDSWFITVCISCVVVLNFKDFVLPEPNGTSDTKFILNSFNVIIKIHMTEQTQVDLTHFWTCVLKQFDGSPKNLV